MTTDPAVEAAATEVAFWLGGDPRFSAETIARAALSAARDADPRREALERVALLVEMLRAKADEERDESDADFWEALVSWTPTFDSAEIAIVAAALRDLEALKEDRDH